VKEELERVYDNQVSNNVDQCLFPLQAAKEQYGEKGQMV
jgi:hypothetical protein